MENSTKVMIGYIVFSLVYLLGTILNWERLVFYGKPLLMLILILAVSLSTLPSKVKKLLLFALLFSWGGDTFLLFQGIDSIYFILGLSSFLISHIGYVILFNHLIKSKDKLKVKPIPILLISIYLAVFLGIMWSHLEAMKIPVTLYALVISLMLYFAYFFFSVDKSNGAKWIFIGAVFFTLSDSILAVNKFYTPIVYSGFLIMSTYIFAQGAIVWGILKLALHFGRQRKRLR